jgi:hypothetical protein
VTAGIAADVDTGVRELEAAFEGRVSIEPDGVGGAYVSVSGLELGTGWNQPDATLAFHLPYNYPAAPPYPFYLPSDASPNGSWSNALQRVEWRGRQVVQVSLRHNNWDPSRDTATGSVLQACDWLRAQ